MVTIRHDEFGNSKQYVLKCNKLNKYVYPAKIERAKVWYEQEDINDGEIPNEPMPMSCNKFELTNFNN